VEDVSMEEDIRYKLPKKKIIPDHPGDKAKDKKHPFSGKVLKDECYSTGNEDGFYDRSERPTKRKTLIRIIIAHKNSCNKIRLLFIKTARIPCLVSGDEW
jgi:hypothetical protein